MPAQLDVYKDWLGITEKERPLNHYQLLRLAKFEDDVAKIRANYRKMNAHIRKFAAGEFQQQSQDLLNELAKCMLCLTDARRKSEYDTSLGRTTDSAGLRTLEQIMLGRKLIDPAQLAKARNYANAVGLEIRDALVQQKLAAPDVVNQAFAESLGLPYLDLEDLTLDEVLIGQIPAVLARAHSCVPVMADQDNLLLASPNPITPEVEEELRLRMGVRNVRTVICSPAQVNDAINKRYPKDAAIQQMQNARGGPAMSASQVAAQPAKKQVAAPAKGVVALSHEEREAIKKKKRMVAIMTFNFATIVIVLTLMNTVFTKPDMFTAFKAILTTLPVSGAIAWAVYKFSPG
ncbi:MAG: hypothetical protein AB7O62_06165 [Pirellulales bacterium]